MDPEAFIIGTENEAFTAEVRGLLEGQFREQLRGLYTEQIAVYSGFPRSEAALLGAAASVFQRSFPTADLTVPHAGAAVVSA